MIRFVLVYADGHTETRDKIHGNALIEGFRRFEPVGIARSKWPSEENDSNDITRVLIEQPFSPNRGRE